MQPELSLQSAAHGASLDVVASGSWTASHAATLEPLVDAIARGKNEEGGEFRAATEDAALGEDFLQGRAAFAAKRAPNFTFGGATSAGD